MATCKDNLQVREKLVELLTGTCHFGQNCIGDCVGCLSDHLIANGVTVQEWIPVTERLPVGNESVLVCRKHLETGHPIIGVEYCILTADGERVWYRDFETWKSVVTHWMPLPLPPKGE